MLLSSLFGKGLISDSVYGSGWNGEVGIAPSKNAVYDEMEIKADVDDPTFTTKITTPQIAFPAAAVPSADPNTMDDYEEGSFTLYIYDASSGGNQGSTGSGTYVKVGKMITLWISLDSIDTSGLTGANAAYFGPLPFTVNSAKIAIGAVMVNDINFSGNYLIIKAVNNATRFSVVNCTDNATSSSLLVSAFHTGSFYMTITYYI